MYFVALYKSEKRRFHLPTIIPLNVSSVLQTVWDYKRKVELVVHTIIVLFYSKLFLFTKIMTRVDNLPLISSYFTPIA